MDKSPVVSRGEVVEATGFAKERPGPPAGARIEASEFRKGALMSMITEPGGEGTQHPEEART